MLAALCALGAAVCAQASPVAAVRLDPVRVFDPASESLIGALQPDLREMSPFAQGVFYVWADAPADRQIAELLARPPSVADRVNLARVLPPSAPPMQAGASVTVPSLDAADPQVADQPAGTPLTVASATPVLPAPIAAPRFGSYGTFTPSLSSVAANVSVPVRIGNVRFNGVMAGSQQQLQGSDAFRAMQACGTTDQNAACPYLRDSNAQTFIAGTDFQVRAGSRNVNLQLSSSVSYMNDSAGAVFSYVPVDPDAQLGAAFDPAAPDTAVLQYPGLADVIKHGVNAQVNVPLNNRLSVGLQYARTHYQGDYGSDLATGVDAYKDTYLGNLSYQLPNTNSVLTLSARQYRYQDSLSPNFNLTQTRADLNFTVKF